MFTIMAAQIFLQAAVLCVILYLVAKHEADYSFAKVAMVTAGAVTGSMLLEMFLIDKIGWLVVFPVLGFIAFMLVTFCWISWGRSIIVIILFSGAHVLLGIGTQVLMNRINDKVQSMGSVGPVSEEDYKTAMEFQEQVFGRLAGKLTGDEPGGARAEEEPGAATARARPRFRGTVLVRGMPATLLRDGKASATDWAAARKELRVSGVMGGANGRRVVVINDQMLQAGEIVSAEHGGNTYRWEVRAVNDSGIDLEPLDVEPAM